MADDVEPLERLCTHENLERSSGHANVSSSPWQHPGQQRLDMVCGPGVGLRILCDGTGTTRRQGDDQENPLSETCVSGRHIEIPKITRPFAANASLQQMPAAAFANKPLARCSIEEEAGSY
jgi:hypothetical protein